MYEKYMVLMFELFQYQIVKTCKQFEVSQEYIQGQLKEAHHQVEILGQKLRRSNKHGF